MRKKRPQKFLPVSSLTSERFFDFNLVLVGPYNDDRCLNGSRSNSGGSSNCGSTPGSGSGDPENEISRNRDFYRNQDVRPPFTYAALIRQVKKLRLWKINGNLGNQDDDDDINSNSAWQCDKMSRSHKWFKSEINLFLALMKKSLNI